MFLRFKASWIDEYWQQYDGRSSKACVSPDPSAPYGGTSPRFAQGGRYDV